MLPIAPRQVDELLGYNLALSLDHDPPEAVQ